MQILILYTTALCGYRVASLVAEYHGVLKKSKHVYGTYFIPSDLKTVYSLV